MSTLNAQRLHRVCDSLYEAAAVAGRWSRALAELSSITGSDSAHFAVWKRARPEPHVAVTASDPNYEVRYVNYGRLDPCRRMLERKACGHWVSNNMHLNGDAVRSDPYHTEFLFPLGLRYESKCRVHESGDGTRYSIFGFARAHASEPFSDPLLTQFTRRLNPHLTRAAALFEKLAPGRVHGRIAEAALDHLPFPCLVVSLERKLRLANRAALDLLAQNDGLLFRNGEVRIEHPDKDRGFVELTSVNRQGGWLHIPRRSGKALAVLASPLPEPVDLPSMQGDRCFLVLVSDPESRPCERLAAGLQRLFRLTAAEARLACRIGQGMTVLEAAAAQTVTEGTARGQLKQVFAKTGLSRQSELVALLIQLHHLLPRGGGQP